MSRQTDLRLSFDDRVAGALARLSPAEARLARAMAAQKEAVVLATAAQIAALTGTSDATVVRTARALGYDSLAALREDLLGELTGAAAPSRLLARTLTETGSDPARILTHVTDLHAATLDTLRQPGVQAAFARALDLLEAGRVRHVFGIGPSGALADYAALQFNRIGLRTQALTQTGVGLADRLLWVESGDVVLMMAYAPLYTEVALLLDVAAERGVPVVLISDSLGPEVSGKVAEVLPVPRGRAEHLALHAGTMVLIESLVLGLAARGKDPALDTLDRLSGLRGTIDRRWLKRGTRKPKAAPADDTPEQKGPPA